jgi:hypothetical protein
MPWRLSFKAAIMAVTDFGAILKLATTLGIQVDEAYRESVIANYERLLQQAALVMAAPLPGTTAGPAEFEP